MPSLSDRTDAHGETRPAAAPRLLTELEPWHHVFFRNLGDLLFLRGQPAPLIAARTAPFWPDVFVTRGLPTRALTQSGLGHVLVLLAIYGISTAWFSSRAGQVNAFRNASITYYNVSEYLPPIESGSEPAKIEKKGEPAFAKQKIISLPRNPDNSRQTIIDPSTTRILRGDVRMPNLVAWDPVPAPVPMAGARDASKIFLPAPDLSVVQPAPSDARGNVARVALPSPSLDVVQPAPKPGGAATDVARLNLPGAALDAVVPPPANATDVTRKPGELNMSAALTSVQVPRLPVPEERAAVAGAGGGGEGASAPLSAGIGGAAGQAAGRLIALGLDPAAVHGPIPVPGGNRSGAFAAGPEGKPGAPGTPDITAGGSGPGGSGSGSGGPGRGSSSGEVPPGITIGAGPNPPGGVVAGGVPTVASPPGTNGNARSAPSNAGKSPLMASVTPPRVGDVARQPQPPNAPAKVEDQVFGARKYYSMALNMPNLTSSGGSWIVNFAELGESRVKGELTAPVPTLKVDPKYPPDLMASRVEGVVTLYAVIHSDGTVGEVRILRGLDDRLDENARTALEHWHFQPATKNGAAVALEAVVQIPFKAFRVRF